MTDCSIDEQHYHCSFCRLLVARNDRGVWVSAETWSEECRETQPGRGHNGVLYNPRHAE